MYDNTIEVLKDFIPLYKVVCFDTYAYTPEDLRRFFIMVQNGRVVAKNLTEDNIKKTEWKSETKGQLKRNFTAIEERLKANLPPNIYETYFLEVSRLIENERYDLAVVQTMVILDWFANEIIENHLISKVRKSLVDDMLLFKLTYKRIWEAEKDSKIRVRTVEKFSDYFPAIGIKLEDKWLNSLRKTYKVRNEIVHHYKMNFVERSVAIEALETGMEIVSFSMKNILNKNNNKTKQLSISEE